MRSLDDERRGCGVAGEHELPPRPRLTENIRRSHGSAGVDRHLLPGLQPSACRAVRDAELVGGRDIETAGPFGLDDRVADRLGAVLDGERLDGVLVPLEPLPRLELHDG